MKRIIGLMLTITLLAAMAIPAMAVGVPEPAAAEYELSYDDIQWEKGYDEGYKLGQSDAAAGRERKSFEYVEGSSYEDGKFYGYDVGYDEFLYEAQRQESVKQGIQSAGGVPGRINVKLNDRCIAFPDAVPELKNGSTMVPVRAVMEALGAKIEVQTSKSFTILRGDTKIQMTVGESKAVVENNGKQEQVALAEASYLKNNRVYIPVSFVSEVFGFTLYWDQDYKSAVLLDRDAIVKQLNERFSTANLFMQSQAKLLTGNWITTGNFNINVEIIDSIDGNKTYTATGTSKTHSGGGAMTMEASLDLSKFSAMLDSFAALSDGQDTSALAMLKPFMKVNYFTMKVVPEGDYYIKSELYDQLATTMLGLTIDKNKETWYRLGHMDPTLLTTEGYTVGNYLYAMTDSTMVYQTPFLCYETLMQTATQLERFVGNDCFTTQGESYVFSMNKEALLRLAGEEEETAQMLSSVFKDLNLTLIFSKSGVYSIRGNVKLKMDGLGSLMNLNLDQRGSSTESSGNMLFQVRNLFNLTMKASSSASKAQTAPDTSISKDAEIIDFMELLMP